MVGNIHRDYFLICIITGLIRGAVRIIVSLVATIVTLVIVFFATPYVSQTIEKYTPLDDMIRQKVVSTMAGCSDIGGQWWRLLFRQGRSYGRSSKKGT